MSELALDLHCPGIAADELFALFADLSRAADAPSVRRVVAHPPAPDGRRVSEWEVEFNDGVLRWSEWDRLDARRRTMRFVRRDGDPIHFEGTWVVRPAAGGCAVRFRGSFDLGLTSFADVVDPLARQALRRNVLDLIRSVAPAAEIVTREETG